MLVTLSRCGYGSNFNELTRIGNILNKKATNKYGIAKIKNEILFYEYLINNNINEFPTPKIIKLSISEGLIDMEYLSQYYPLYKNFNKKSLQKVYYYLDKLHQHKIEVSKDIFFRDLKIEMYDKIIERFSFVEPYLLDTIKKVNYKIIYPFRNALDILYKDIYNFYNKYSTYEYCIIHGDCQFNNILVQNSISDSSKGTIDEPSIIFIDPRGYYGETKIYGLCDYDYSKVLFALSGYDTFDNSIIPKLDIQDDNINIDIKMLNNLTLENENIIHKLILIIIWMGNAHCFQNDINKMLTSYYYGMYLFSVIYNLP
jgi:hypothetical protein